MSRLSQTQATDHAPQLSLRRPVPALLPAPPRRIDSGIISAAEADAWLRTSDGRAWQDYCREMSPQGQAWLAAQDALLDILPVGG